MSNWTLYKKLLFMMLIISIFVYFFIVASQKQVFADIDEQCSIVKIYAVSIDPFHL